MRDTQPVHVRLFGDRNLAKQYVGWARKLLGTAREIGAPRMSREMPDGTLVEVIADTVPPVLSITAPAPIVAPAKRVSLQYQFVSTGTTRVRDASGTLLGYALRTVFAPDADGVMQPVPVATAASAENGEWPYVSSQDLSLLQPVPFADRSFGSPDVFYPDVRLARGARAGRRLYGPRMDGAAAVAMNGFHASSRARVLSEQHPYAERDGAPVVWCDAPDSPGVTVVPDGLDAVHGFAMIRADGYEVMLMMDSYSRLWALLPGSGNALAIDMPLPDWVFRGPDNGNVGERAAYKWRFSSDGSRCCAVVFERHAPVIDGDGVTLQGPRVPGYAFLGQAAETAPILLDAGGLVEFSVNVEMTNGAITALSASLTNARRTQDFGCGILAADYAWTDDALVTATVDLHAFVSGDFQTVRSVAFLSIGRDGEEPAIRARMLDRYQRPDGAFILSDLLWTAINGMDLRALSACFIVKNLRQGPVSGHLVTQHLDVSVLAYVGGQLSERIDAGDSAFSAWSDLDPPAETSQILVGDSLPARLVMRTSITSGNPDTLVDAGLWQLGPMSGAFNDFDPLRTMCVHPDGHYAVCSAPVLACPSGITSDFLAESVSGIDVGSIESLVMDVISITDDADATVTHRMKHIDCINGAFSKSLGHADFNLSVIASDASHFAVSANGGTVVHATPRYVLGIQEFDDAMRVVNSDDVYNVSAWTRVIGVDSPAIAAQMAFGWRLENVV